MSATDERTARERAERSREDMRRCGAVGERSLDNEPTQSMAQIVFWTTAVLALRYIGDAIMAVADELRAGREDGDAETIGKLKGRIERLIHRGQPSCTPEQWDAAQACVAILRDLIHLEATPDDSDYAALEAFDEACRKTEEQ